MLHQDDLIFCKTESGVTSCGYNISNMLLKNTLNIPHSQYGHHHHHTGSTNKTSKDDIRIAKLMEDLVVPSGLYYCHPMTKHKVFNYKSMQDSPHSPRLTSREKGEKDEINITNGMLDESVYDKLLSLVSMDKKKLFDRKTRKNKGALFQKVIDNSSSMDSNIPMDMPVVLDTPRDIRAEKGEKPKKNKSLKIKINLKPQEQQQQQQKLNQRKTKKVRFVKN
jgi:hypothetical protein